MYICPCCGEEDEARKFMKTALVSSTDSLADYALEGNKHTFNTTDLLLGLKFVVKLRPILKPHTPNENRQNVTSYNFVPYLAVSYKL